MRRATGRSPQVWLHEALHREARELLEISGLQVAQMAFRPGVSGPALFQPLLQGLGWHAAQPLQAPRSQPATSCAAWP
ncbi:MAG: hypothetical protein HWE37_04490 [Rhodobacteraceae bacterium]|nr:hypothetical protein [Paracoccaceae bacterium]